MTIGLNWNQYHKASFPTVATFHFPNLTVALLRLLAKLRPHVAHRGPDDSAVTSIHMTKTLVFRPHVDGRTSFDAKTKPQ